MTLSTGSVEPIVAPALRSCALFRDMDDAALAEVAGRLRHRRFRRHEVIFHAGDPGDALFIVVSGSLKIVLPSPEGNEAIIATLRPGDFFGELAVLDGEPRSATAVALEPTELEALARAPFLELVAHPAGAASRAADRPCGRAPPPHEARRGAALPRPAGPPRDAPGGACAGGGWSGTWRGALVALHAVRARLHDRGLAPERQPPPGRPVG